jgi:predicted nucleic acid-binding protein
MTHVEKFVAVLDANVLYPAPLCDFLLRLAELDLFSPKWSESIHEEWIRNLLVNRSDLKTSQLEKRHQAMDSAFPDANVTGFKNLIPGLTLPDEDDRHVLAAAIKSNADLIITFNKKDFPAKNVKQHNIKIEDPDEFICQLLKTDLPKVLQALLNQVKALKNPPQSIEQILTTLENCGLPVSIAIIKDALVSETVL